MVSGTFSDSPVWWHYMYINVPNNYQPNSLAFYFIDSGTNLGSPTSTHQQSALQISTTFKSISAVIMDVPNQPIVFKVSLFD